MPPGLRNTGKIANQIGGVMPEPAHGIISPVISGTPARTRGLRLLRGACLITLVAIAAQFTLGTILNLYVEVPSSVAHAGWLRQVETAPAPLTVHAVLGLILLGGAIVVTIQSIALRSWSLVAAAGTGLVALLGAFGAGEAFVEDGSNGESLTMAVLGSVGVLCYAIVQAIAGAMAHRAARQA